jgi:4-amino-4-deoxy-L-arabinose transferase-like glycosyltransferase
MTVLADEQTVRVGDGSVQKQRSWPSCFFSYELYFIIIIASFLRLYGIQTTEFDADQADIFRMAHDAVIHGHLVATSNIASIGVYNPPGIIYALMIPAAFSANPIGGAIETALLAIGGVFLTYWFTRRYYGRVAATIASSLFAVTSASLFYSRFMWNQNLLLFFVPLFMIVLFRGVVDRKPGWLFPAIFLYGLLFQWHGSSLLLVAPLVVAWLLAPKTVRWRDILLGLLSLMILYSPYIIWQVATNFATLSRLFQPGPLPPTLDSQAWLFYLHFLNPYDKPLANSLALLYKWQRYFNWLHPVMKVLILAATLFVFLLALFLRKKKKIESGASRMTASWWSKVWYWISDLRKSPYHCGLLVLLIWQIFPLLDLSRHTLVLFPHYFIILMPGPFILIGILLARSADWFRVHGRWYRWVSAGIYAFSCLLLLFQAIAGTASVLDSVQGHFVDKNLSNPYYNDLNSLQQALTKADQIAQQDHLSRIFVVADQATKSSFRYLSEQLHTPATVVDGSCLLLPSSSASPVVVLVSPYETTLDAFFSSGDIHVNRSYTSPRLGGDPFRLYVVDPLPQAATQATLSSDLQFVSAQAQSLQKQSWIVTRWNLLQSASASSRSTYSYQFTDMDIVKGSTQARRICTSTSLQKGDQLIVFLPHTSNQISLPVQVRRSSATPYAIRTKLFGPIALVFDTFQQDSTPWMVLKTTAGASTITVPIALSS